MGGCAGQYKNRFNFINICHHSFDFNLDCEWNFFATSHGKGPCDGVGGTVKRTTAKASLQRPINSQILTLHDMYSFCTTALPSIHFMFVSFFWTVIIDALLTCSITMKSACW